MKRLHGSPSRTRQTLLAEVSAEGRGIGWGRGYLPFFMVKIRGVLLALLMVMVFFVSSTSAGFFSNASISLI